VNPRHFTRDNWLALGVIALLLVILFAVTLSEQEEQMPPYSTISTEAEGVRALWLWAQELGYETNDARAFNFAGPPTTADLAFIIEPAANIGEAEWAQLDGWVESGGTLVIAGDGLNARLAFGRYDLDLAFGGFGDTAVLQLPVAATPPIAAPIDLQSFSHFAFSPEKVREDIIVHVAQNELPVLVSFPQGEGQIILSSSAYPFTNVGLQSTGNAQLMRNMLATAVDDGEIWFDDWHHGLRGTIDPGELSGPIDWLRFTAGGQALLFAALLLFIFILLSGRRFGRPIPLPTDLRRRGSLEYVNAIANLNQRARHSYPVQVQYHQQLKRTLGRRYRLDPDLPDEQYLAQLAQYKTELTQLGQLDIDNITILLGRLRQRDLSQADLLTLAQEAHDVMSKLK
jgi:hypothetical protein